MESLITNGFDAWQQLNLKYQHQPRDLHAVLQFTLAGISFGMSEFDLVFWGLSFVTLILQTMINVVIGHVIYETILSRRNTAVSYIIGYGIILPTICYLSIAALQLLKFHNIAHMLCLSATGPAILTFRCVEAMHGTLPAFAYDLHKSHKENCRWRFLLYFCSSIQLHFDAKGIVQTITRDEIGRKIRFFIRMFCETMILYSILIPTEFVPFPTKPRINVSDYLYWGNLANNYIVAYCMSVCLESGVTGLGLMVSLLTGYSTLSIHDDPLLLSSSVREFWGRRWNRMVRAAMHRGVYIPLRNAHCPRYIGAMATFLASGALHEYFLYLFTFREGSDYVPNYGNQTLFFFWNALVIVMEYALQGVKLQIGGFQWRHLSRPVRTLLVLMTVLPVSHWFMDEYVNAKFFADIAMGFPRVFVMKRGTQ